MTLSQHHAVLAAEAEPVAVPPEPGPIAVLPTQEQGFIDAVHAGAGVVEPISEATRGVVWLSSSDAMGLAEVLDAHPRIGWVQLPFAGVDAFSEVLASHARPGVIFTSAKGAYAQPVAEHALMLALALLRVIPKRVRATSWDTGKDGRSLYGLNVLIVGAGGIAHELIRLLEPFRTPVTVLRRSPGAVPGAAQTLFSDATGEVLLGALQDADVVVLAAASTANTRHMFSTAQFEAMKRSAYLVNIARGPLIDTDALVDALASGTIAGAGIDVTDPEPLPDGHPLWDEPNCIITPHSADTPEMIAPLLAERIRLNVQALHGDGRFVGVVDAAAGY